MKIEREDVDRLSDVAFQASKWLHGNGFEVGFNFDKALDLCAKRKDHRKDGYYVMRHSVIRKIQKFWFKGLMGMYTHAAVDVSTLPPGTDINKLQKLLEDVTECYQFIEWFVIDSLNKDNLDADDHKEADEEFAEQERQYRKRSNK